MNLKIRNYHPSDLCDIYSICLKTGRSGRDATALYKDPLLLGHYYAAPYVVYEPDCAFVLTLDGNPAGYVLGTKNTESFSKKCEAKWLPVLRERYPLPEESDHSNDARIINLIHEGYPPREEAAGYPAQLHIDILPEEQGKGQGKKLMQKFVDHLKIKDVEGLHFRVSVDNPGALEFYKAVGYKIIHEGEFTITFGIKL